MRNKRDLFIGLGVGLGVMLALNHARWAVFPISGGPVGINRILGGPPEPVVAINTIPRV